MTLPSRPDIYLNRPERTKNFTLLQSPCIKSVRELLACMVEMLSVQSINSTTFSVFPRFHNTQVLFVSSLLAQQGP